MPRKTNKTSKKEETEKESTESYSLRPKRVSKGKYRELAGLSDKSFPSGEITVTLESPKKAKNSETSNVVKIKEEITEDEPNSSVTVIRLYKSVTEESVKEEYLEFEMDDEDSEEEDVQIEKPNTPLRKITDVLRKNDQLVDKDDDFTLVLVPSADSGAEENEPKEANTKSQFTLEGLKDMLCRPMKDEEEKLVKKYLEEGHGDAIIDLLFGRSATDRVRKCLVCAENVFGNDAKYAAHYRDAHDSEPAFVCELCGKVISQGRNYQSHLRSHFTSLTCKICARRFRTEAAFEKHKETHGEDNNSDNQSAEESSAEGKTLGGDFSCAICSASFSARHKLQQHVHMMHESKPCVCDICGKTLKHHKSLYSHRRTHTDPKTICDVCGTTLKNPRYLKQHMMLHQNVEKPYKCDKCEKAYHTSSALRVHIYYNHSNTQGRFTCTVCGKVFKAKQGLQFHMDSHSDELRYECKYCKKRFRGFKTCKVHEIRHQEAENPGKYKCEICSKVFKSRQTFKNHQDVHATFNRYQCSICEKRFKLRKSCLAHLRNHQIKAQKQKAENLAAGEDSSSSMDGVKTSTKMSTVEEGVEVESIEMEECEEFVITLANDDDTVVHLDEDGVVQLIGQGDIAVELEVPDARVACEIVPEVNEECEV